MNDAQSPPIKSRRPAAGKAKSLTTASSSRKPRFTRESPEQRRRNLIQAAIRCLGRGGISAFRVEQICAEAKVSLGLLNHYFSSKNELLIAVYRAAFYDHMEARIARARRSDTISSPNAVSRLCHIVDGMIDPTYLEPANLMVWLALWGEIVMNPSLKRAHKALYRSFIAALADLIQAVADERRRTVKALELARNLTALVDGLFLERALDRQALTYRDLRRAGYNWLTLYLGDLDPARN